MLTGWGYHILRHRSWGRAPRKASEAGHGLDG